MQISQENPFEDPLAPHSPESVSLLNSRHRADHEFSQLRSTTKYDCEQQMQEFIIQIEERFKLSIANKIYTFPRKINCISDIVSSSEDEQSVTFKSSGGRAYEQYSRERSKIKGQQLFKSDRESTKKQTVQNYKLQRDASLKDKNKDQKVLLKQKSKTKSHHKLKSNKKSKKQSKNKEKQPVVAQIVLKQQKIKKQRLKTELSQSDMLDSIREKFRHFL